MSAEKLRGKYLLIMTDGYSLDYYSFHDSLEDAQTKMKKDYEKSTPSSWKEDFKEMSHCSDTDAILFDNGDYVLVWNIISLTENYIPKGEAEK